MRGDRFRVRPGDAIVDALESLDLQFPTVSKAQLGTLAAARKNLKEESGEGEN